MVTLTVSIHELDLVGCTKWMSDGVRDGAVFRSVTLLSYGVRVTARG